MTKKKIRMNIKKNIFIINQYNILLILIIQMNKIVIYMLPHYLIIVNMINPYINNQYKLKIYIKLKLYLIQLNYFYYNKYINNKIK